MIIWGHRGAGFRGVENSLSSFKKAVDMGVDGIINQVKLENGESIPTLRKVFEVFSNKIRYNFDIFVVDTGIKIIELATEYNLINNVEITKPVAHTKSAESLFKPLREIIKDITLVCSLYSEKQISEDNYGLLDHMKELGFQVINLSHHQFNLEIFNQAKKAGFKFYLWSVLFKYFMKKYLNLNYNGQMIDGIFTNYPDKLVELRTEIFI